MINPMLTVGRAALTLLAAGGLAAAETAWRPLFNGKDLTGWSAWLAKPPAILDLPGEPKDEKGNYLRPLGADREPFNVFTVVTADGRPAVRVSGQIFGELRSRETFANYHLRLLFKWGDKKWPPRNKPETPRDSGLPYHVHAPPGEGGRTWASSIELQIQEHDVGESAMFHLNLRATCWPGGFCFGIADVSPV